MKNRLLAIALTLAATAAFAATSDSPLSQYHLHRGNSTWIHSLEPSVAHPDSGDYLAVVYEGREYVIRDAATIDRAVAIMESTAPIRRAKREAKSRARELRQEQRELEREARHAESDAERARIEAEISRLDAQRTDAERAVGEANRKAAAAKDDAQQQLAELVAEAIRSGKAR